MRPEAPLSPSAAKAILDLLAPQERPTVDEAALFALALGAADEEERVSCARAMLASPTARAQYLRIRGRVSARSGAGADLAETMSAPERARRFVEALAEVARAIDRTVAEGRWSDASETLRANLPELRAAWRAGGSFGLWAEAEAIVRSLAFPLLESGVDEDFAEVVGLGYRASAALGRPGLRSWLLSYEGVWAARKDDPDRALELWGQRIALNRKIGNRTAEADALLDSVLLLSQRGERERMITMLDETERAVIASGRADMEANFWAVLTDDRRRAGDLETAMEHLDRSLAAFRTAEGALGIGLHIRYIAAQTLAQLGKDREALDVLIEALEICVESGESVTAALSLANLGEILESQGSSVLAIRCLALSLAIHRQVGTRHEGEARASLDAMRARHPASTSDVVCGREPERVGSWAAETGAILALLRESRPTAVAG